METLTENIWQKSKWLVKGVIIGVMALLLLIPAYFVENLIMERETRQKEMGRPAITAGASAGDSLS